MDEHTLALLEWPAIQEMLAAEAASPLGRELARGVRPLRTPVEARSVQEEIGEFRILLSKETALPFDRIFDVRESVRLVRPEGAVLPAMELLRVAVSLEAAEAIRLVLGRSRGICPRLHAVASRLDGQADLVAEIRGAIEETGEVKDTASRELAQIRRRLHDLRNLIQSRLQSLLTDSTLQPFIAEPIITLRNERYVIPVKPNYRTALRGMVQDRSASGVTIFLEPQEVVELNNQVRLLQRSEEEEVRRVLELLTAALRPKADSVLRTVLLAVELELRYAAARLADKLDCAPPSLREAGPLVLLRARHPLLLRQALAAAGREVTPIDVRVGGDFDALLITGPNTGGKTVALKTAGLLSLMALAGLHLPASPDSEVPFFNGVTADIGDEQSIEQSLSTFSSHIGHIRRILETVERGSLVLLDELGAGTDPAEGACLGIAILEALLERGALLIATSHLDAIKAYAHSHPRIENGCVEFDLDTLRPLYRLSIGPSGRSHAIAIASRIGLSPEVIQRANTLLGEGGDPLRLLVEGLEAEQRRLAEERETLAGDLEEAARARGEAEVERDAVRAEAVERRQQARREVDHALVEARSEIDRLLREVRTAESRGRTARDVRERLTELEQRTGATLAGVADPGRAADASDAERIRHGQQVRIKGFDQRGTVSGEPTPAGMVEIHLPLGRVRLPLEAVVRDDGSGQSEIISPVQVSRASKETPAELNLIGCDASEAARRLDHYLGDAFLAGLPSVRIIHGKGGGVLRRTVAELLQGHPLVESFRLGDYREGGIGTTIVALHSHSVPLGGAA
ncbi:MAG: endonuclease MutS2 [Candidatus Methylomirabilis oxyfera]|nr:endonuclease MutS2 [Candidatus Methylomirabilis oxyfera]